MSKNLSIDRCRSHGFWAICINDDVGGTRLTNGKCCGSWEPVKEWPVTDDDIRRIIKTLEGYLTT